MQISDYESLNWILQNMNKPKQAVPNAILKNNSWIKFIAFSIFLKLGIYVNSQNFETLLFLFSGEDFPDYKIYV